MIRHYEIKNSILQKVDVPKQDMNKFTVSYKGKASIFDRDFNIKCIDIDIKDLYIKNKLSKYIIEIDTTNDISGSLLLKNKEYHENKQYLMTEDNRIIDLFKYYVNEYDLLNTKKIIKVIYGGEFENEMLITPDNNLRFFSYFIADDKDASPKMDYFTNGLFIDEILKKTGIKLKDIKIINLNNFMSKGKDVVDGTEDYFEVIETNDGQLYSYYDILEMEDNKNG